MLGAAGRPDQMSERPEPDLDQVRKAMREHDERTEQPKEPDRPAGEDEEEAGGESERVGGEGGG
jgi:hypothetical protein